MGTDQDPLTLSEWAVLALVAEGPTHGFAVAELLGPDSELGAIWTVKRSLVYRSLNELKAHGLIAERGPESSKRGPARTPVASTRSGRTAVKRWLESPVHHVRDIRHVLLLKLAFLARRGESPRPLLEAQLDELRPILHGLSASRRGGAGVERLALEWRVESARAAERFVKRQLDSAD